jgi:hypothetical protein
MSVKQLTVFLENKLGRLAEVARILKNENINLQGFSTTEARDYGILRIIVSDTDKARDALRVAGFTTHVAEIICVGVYDKPGELSRVLDVLASENINVDYIYVIAGTRIALSVGDIERAEKILSKSGFTLCT